MVSASVYVDEQGATEADAMTATAARDEELASGKFGGLNAVLFKRLPIREWDRWLDAKMAHPFFVPVIADPNPASNGYIAEDGPAADLLAAVPTSVPSGAFGGSEDWTLSSQGQAAFSARPPLAPDEAWTSNRHIYLKDLPASNGSEAASDGPDFGQGLGTCITTDNPG